MSSALDDVAAAADAVADDQRRVARKARVMQRRRDRGWSWTTILEREGEPRLLDLLRRSGRRVSDMTARLALALAAGLRAEGASTRQAGRRLGVSHQRVVAMLKNGRRPDGA